MSNKQRIFIKGIGILLIMIHNYVLILLEIDCNEMAYSQKATDEFLAHVFTADSIWYFFGFVGWIGVPLFFFLSGYGLTKKYNSQFLESRSYILGHLKKLWKLLIPIYLLYIIIYSTNIQSAIAHLTFTINLFYYLVKDIYMDPGVYWFFGAILQFYILFIWIRKLSTPWLWVLCAVFLVVQYGTLYFESNVMSNWIRHNFLGWGVPFILGVIWARNEKEFSKRSCQILCVLSFLLLCNCLVIKWLIPFTEVAMIVFVFTLSKVFTSKWLGFIGIISPSIFVLHPLIRMLFYSIYFEPHLVLITTIIYVILVLFFAWVHHRLLKYLDSCQFMSKLK